MEQTLWAPIVITCLALLFLLRRLSSQTSDPKSLTIAPGPPTLPLLGNLHQLTKGGKLVHHTLSKLAHVHGPIMTVWLGSWRPMIVVSDAKLAWEVLVNKSSDYADRALPYNSRPVNADMRTVVSSDVGSHWHSLRRGLQSGPLGPVNLSAQFNFQEKDIELMIRGMVVKARENNGVVKPLSFIRLATISLLSRLCFGCDFNDEAFHIGMDRVVEEVLDLTGHASIAESFAFARFIPFLNHAFIEVEAAMRNVVKLLRPMLSYPAPPSSLLHVLLDQNQPEEVTIKALFEVFMLGLDSMASTIAWALAFLVHHQDIQERLYQEVLDYAGDKMLRAEEVAKLPYLQAVVKETMRMKPIAPLAVPHKTTRDTTLGGRRVEKGTIVTVNIYAVHYDPKTWPEPHRFNPKRFLADGKSGSGELQSFLPFGGGMRACAGMELGKLQVALVVANLVKALKWLPEKEGNLPDLREEMNFVLMMKTPLAARIIARDEDRTHTVN